MRRGAEAPENPLLLPLSLLVACANAKPTSVTSTLDSSPVLAPEAVRATTPCLGRNGVKTSNGSLANPQLPLALNHVDGCAYPHHPVMLTVPAGVYPLQREYITEWNGLRVPAHYDCDIFNGMSHWGPFHYFYEVHTRWFACWSHHAALQSGNTLVQPSLPLVDDEYNEQLAVFQSVIRARKDQRYVVAELGARWGTWGSRAAAFARAMGLDYYVHFVEASRIYCDAIPVVMAANALRPFTVECARAAQGNMRQWLLAQHHVDLIDMDIQGAEADLVPAILHLLERKVYRLIIGTHSPEVHNHLQKLLVAKRGWILIFSAPHIGRGGACVQDHVRGRYGRNGQTGRFDWQALLRKGCYHVTPRGPVANFDGELILDNPRFVHRDRALAMDDTAVRIDDLIDNQAGVNAQERRE
mmetsp:Transcript_13844/g.41855  ORF Transcript_13844/g.41855 Transcript_13844/m.41855 type:complete len:413 (-) Transcript_13844:69-1307(-)